MSVPDCPLGCPRHGSAEAVDLGERIRCDCLETLLAWLAPLRMGKWVRAACAVDLHQLARTGCVTVASLETTLNRVGDAVETRGNAAIAAAILAAYHLGLKGGVPPGRVRTCARCHTPFILANLPDIDLAQGTTCTPCAVANE